MTILHQDNASSHTTRLAINHLSTQEDELMGHLPDSPDLAPMTFFVPESQE